MILPRKPEHVHIAASDVLYPNNSGGRMEELGALRSIESLGVKVSMTLMQREDLSENDARLNREVLSNTALLRRGSAALMSLKHPLMPYELSSRLFSRWVPQFDSPPTTVLAQHEWTLPLARRIAERYGARLFLRSHNDEIEYLRSLRDPAPHGFRRMYFSAELLRAKRMFTREYYDGVSTVLTISDGDAEFYRERGLAVETVPPSLGLEVRDGLDDPPSEPVAVFGGSMDMPYVVDGLQWFIDNVLPRITRHIPRATFTIMGRRCPETLAKQFSANPHVRFLGEVPDIIPHLRASRIFVNPVFRGSGVNMKLGAPASLGLPVVTTSVGARGVGGLTEAFSIADDAEAFTRLCFRLLRDDDVWRKVSTNLARRVPEFSVDAVAGAYQRVMGLSTPRQDGKEPA